MTAPDFPAGLEWLNTDRPLKLADLRGKVVLIDFWTYCCINCMHIIPDLKRLEAEYPDELVVIGVHSAKFTQEGETANIRQAILRYEIEHPVINDRRFAVWQLYSANSWPTVVLIDPEGKMVMSQAGEGVYAHFAEPIKRLVESFDKAGKIDRKSLDLKKESSVAAEGYLSYPGKVLAIGAESDSFRTFALSHFRTLFISDQNHNRIVATTLDGSQVIETIGSGKIGFDDGSFESATFNHPQGMALVGDVLYIADTENHAVRAANLATREVTTLAGNGTQALGWGASEGIGRNVALSSPWDLAYKDSLLYVAMAGTHQIWTIRTSDGFSKPFAGTSREGLFDAPRNRASLAQPSGLAIIGDRLYFADSEVSAIRYVELSETGRVGTVVGLDLFEFGDKDGFGDSVRLQHPLGVTTDGKLLYVADTYNSKIKIIDPETRQSKTLFGDGKPGLKDGNGTDARLYEPGGLYYSEGKLYIADTNNGKIRVGDLSTLDMTTLELNSPNFDPQPKIESKINMVGNAGRSGRIVGAGSGKITVDITVPSGFKINQESPVILTLLDGGGVAKAIGSSSQVFEPSEHKKFSLPVEWLPGSGTVTIEFDLIYCGEHNADVCIPGSVKLSKLIFVEGSGPTELILNADITQQNR